VICSPSGGKYLNVLLYVLVIILVIHYIPFVRKCKSKNCQPLNLDSHRSRLRATRDSCRLNFSRLLLPLKSRADANTLNHLFSSSQRNGIKVPTLIDSDVEGTILCIEQSFALSFQSSLLHRLLQTNSSHQSRLIITTTWHKVALTLSPSRN
jgi:hypothetical protein